MKTTKDLRPRYWSLVKAGMCTVCRKAKATNGRKCEPCWRKHIKHDKKSRNKLKPQREKAGICNHCGVHPARPRKKTCLGCATRISYLMTCDWKPGMLGRPAPMWATEEQRIEHRTLLREARAEQLRQQRADLVKAGICVRCTDAPARTGKQTCYQCSKIASQITMAGQQRAKKKLATIPRNCKECNALIPLGSWKKFCDSCSKPKPAMSDCIDCGVSFHRLGGYAVRCDECRIKYKIAKATRYCECGTQLKKSERRCPSCRVLRYAKKIGAERETP